MSPEESRPPAAPVALSRAKTPIVAWAQHFPKALRLRLVVLVSYSKSADVFCGPNELEVQFVHLEPYL